MFNCATVKNYLSRYYDNECPKNIHDEIAKYLNSSEKCGECRQCVKILDDYEYVRMALSHLPEYNPSKEYKNTFSEKLAACKNEQNSVARPVFKKKRIAYAYLSAAAMIVFFLGTLLFTTPTIQPDKSVPIITYLQGKAYIADTSSDTPRLAMVKNIINKGDTIATGPHSKIDIEMKNKFKITLRQNSVLKVEELTEEADRLRIICRLERGGILADVTKHENSSDFQILTELVEVAVKGTQFSVETEGHDDNKKVTVAVFEGAVAVKQAQAKHSENSYAEHLIRENYKMVFANDVTAIPQQLNDDEIESFWEVYEIGNRSTDINYQASSSDNKDIYRSQSK